LVINGVFRATDRGDAVALALEARGQDALAQLPEGLQALPRDEVALRPFGVVGLGALRALSGAGPDIAPAIDALAPTFRGLAALLPALEQGGHGVVFTMGKGGVGKTSVAVSIAVALARRGHQVHLSTTDPAAHVADALGAPVDGVTVGRIDPEVETRAYRDEVLATAGAGLDAAARALLEEDLRSPCTEEIAVFRAFARAVAQAERGFVVLDTAPSGHTLLLLDAAESYHREVLKRSTDAPPEVVALLPRLRDPAYTKVLLVTLPEATPVHEARALQRDLERAGIHPFAWVINQSLTPLAVRDPVLVSRRAHEAPWLTEVASLGLPVALVPWLPTAPGARVDLTAA
jgi:arsenite-transporting ATPase